jgi:hypothetical protein
VLILAVATLKKLAIEFHFLLDILPTFIRTAFFLSFSPIIETYLTASAWILLAITAER